MTQNLIDNKNVIKLQKLLGYRFKDIKLLIQALSHPSINGIIENKNKENYERLEFLGDALINFIVTEMLFKTHLDSDQGKLSKLRTTLVCQDKMHTIAFNLGIQEYMIFSKGEDDNGGRSKPSNLEDCLEAIIGAIYLDSNFDTIKTIVLILWRTSFDVDLIEYDPKSSLQEWAQKRKKNPIYNLVSKIGKDHEPIFYISIAIDSKTTIGTGSSKKLAEKDAARKMLKLVNIENS